MRVLSENYRASRRTPLHESKFLYRTVHPNILVSAICKKTAQLIDKGDLQVPLRSDLCTLFCWKSFAHNQFRTATSLFSWKSLIFNVFPKTYRGVWVPMLTAYLKRDFNFRLGLRGSLPPSNGHISQGDNRSLTTVRRR
jgi:hypothetical protein